MIAARLTLPAAPRTDSIPSPAAANNPNTNSTSFERSLALSQRAANIKEHARADERLDRSAPARKDPARKSEQSKDQGVDAKELARRESIEAKSPQETKDIQAADGEELIRDADTHGEEQSTPAQVNEPVKAETDERSVEVEEEAIVVEEVSEEQEQSIELAQVNAVAVELVQQVTTSLAFSQAVADDAAVTNQVAAPAAAAQSHAAPIGKVTTGAKVQAQVEAVDAETSVLSSTTARQGDASQVVAVVPDAAMADGEDDAPVKARVAESIEPQVAQAVKALPALESGSHATAASGSQGTPSMSAGESIAAQFAQLPQTQDAESADDVNIGRLTRGLNSAINQRGGSVTLKLTPPELGAVRIDMAVRDGVVNAKFTAQTESVRNLLMDQMGQLRQALDRQGLSVDKIEVQLTPQQSSGGSFNGSQRQADESNQDGRSAGQYASQGGQGGRDGRERSDRSQVDTFENAMAQVAE